jgi:hypothetical protein
MQVMNTPVVQEKIQVWTPLESFGFGGIAGLESVLNPSAEMGADVCAAFELDDDLVERRAVLRISG